MRRDNVNGPSQPVRNLAQNARWAKESGVNQIVRQNLCPSPRGIVALLHYSGAMAQTITPNVTIASHPLGITRAIRFTYGPSSSNPGLNIMSTPLASTTYTMSAWVYIGSLTSTPGGGGFAENSIISGSNIDLSKIGEWQRIVWTRTTSATPGPNFGIRFSAVGGTGTGDILVTGIQIDTTTLDTPFFDGATAAAGDFTYGWAGAANNSPSREYGKGASLSNTTGSAYRAAYISSELPADGGKFLRLFTHTTGVPVAVNPTDVSIKDGVPRTDLLWMRSNRTMAVSMRYRNPSGSNVVAAPVANLVAGRWQLYRNFATPTGADDMALGPLATTAIQAGDTIDLGPHMTVEGEYTGDVLDGFKPFSKWLGETDLSISVGYPPQFLDIAGKPAVDVEGVGNRANTGVPDAFMGRTIYSVYEVNDQVGSYNVCSSYGVIGSKGFMTQTAAEGSINMANRYDLPGGTFNGGLVFNSRTSRRHVQAIAFKDGLNEVSACADGGADQTKVVDPGTTGWDDSRAQCTANNSIRNLRFIVFNAYHDRAKRLEMSRYLGAKYGAYVA